MINSGPEVRTQVEHICIDNIKSFQNYSNYEHPIYADKIRDLANDIMKLMKDKAYFSQKRLEAVEARKQQGFNKIQGQGDLKSKIASLVKMY